ncbi:MAG: DUF481 domain-containing protein [Chlorobiaceae bacterium]|nr:DUF481 domain-containing protein [Chlorobiaceae bacterium]
MHRIGYRSVVTTLALLLIAPAASGAAETIVMDNGDRLSGQLVRMADGILELETGYAGMVKAAWNHVREITTDGMFDVRLNGDEVVAVQSLRLQDGSAFLDDRCVPLVNVKQLNPADWELGRSAKISGEIDVALKMERGNTHDDLTDLQGRLEWKKRMQRIRLGGEFQYNQNGRDVTADRWSVEATYDNNASKRFYFGEGTSFKSDRMGNLILRWAAGPYAGVHLIDTQRTRLNAETGLDYASDNYRSQPVETFLAESWRVEFSHFIIPDKLEIYHRDSGLFSLTSSAGFSFDTWTGLKFPVASGMYTSTEIKTTFNGDAPPEASAWDTTYRFKIGYQW